MLSNDVVRRLRYALNLRNREVQTIVGLGGHEMSDAEVRAILQREHEEDYVECSIEQLTGFLDGLIVHLRGAREEQKESPTQILASDNNIILRKLRIALDLRAEDMLGLLALGGFQLSKHELSALFRKRGHNHYRECGDQVLRYFLLGLTRQRRPDADPEDEASADLGKPETKTTL